MLLLLVGRIEPLLARRTPRISVDELSTGSEKYK